MDVGNSISLPTDTWSFAQSAENFDAHILQSVPHCQEQREFIAALSRFFLHEGALAYEIGVSTGRTAQAVLKRIAGRRVHYLGIDIEPRMVEAARRNLASDQRFAAQTADVASFDFAKADLFIAYYTLQFIPLATRGPLLDRIYAALQPGGALVCYEKTLAENARSQDMFTQLYNEFKAEQGFAEDAIANKAHALQGVAFPVSYERNRAMLAEAGFTGIETIFRSHCFVGFLAFKE